MPVVFSRWRARGRALFAAAVSVALLAAVAGPAGAAHRVGYEQVIRLTFPVAGPTDYIDTYHAPRAGGRVHQATDVMAKKGQKVHAAKRGTICWIPGIDGPMPSYGYMITVCAKNGRRYSYVHLNNDTPGTDDGKGGPEHAYAKGLEQGSEVVRGQLLGWVGDSGNAEATAPHLHFEIEDPELDDPRIQLDGYDPERINPYYSLRAAERRGDYPGQLFPR